MHPNEKKIHAFYEAFARRDGRAMGEAYGDEVRFSDPVFPDLRGDRARAMWRMLCARAKDLTIVHENVVADGVNGSARWTATYTFAATGRPVVNRIEARFAFRDGKVIDHVDTFDFWKWSRQALGAPGIVLGWSPMLRRKVQKQAARGLDAFVAKE